MWTLCEALWGRLGDHDLEPEGDGSYREQHARRRSFSRWLSESAAQSIQEEVCKSQTQNHVDAIFSYLTGHCIPEACRLAQKNGEKTKTHLHTINGTNNVLCVWFTLVIFCFCASLGDHRLSLLLSQAVGSQFSRDLLALQLADWNRMQTDSFIQEERLQIFALLAGKPVRLKCMRVLGFGLELYTLI